MNRNKIILFFLIFIVLNSFCKQAQSQLVQSKAIITGKVQSTTNSKVSVTNSPISLGDDWHYTVDKNELSFDIDYKGQFIAEIPVDKPDFYRFTINDETFELFINPSDQIFITIDSVKTITGSNAHFNQFFIELSTHLKKNNTDNLFRKGKELFTEAPDSFKSKIDSLKQISTNIYQEFIAEYKAPLLFIERCFTDINCCYKYSELVYPVVFENITGKTLKLNPDYFIKIGNNTLNHPNLLNSSFYMQFLDTYVDYKSANNFNINSFYNLPREKIVSTYNVIKNLEIDSKIKNYLLEEHFKVCAINYSPKDWGKIFFEFKKNCKDNKLLAKVEKSYKEAMDLRTQASEIKIYKEIDGIQLEAHIFYPENFNKNGKYATYVFFHGGGWGIGMPEWGYENCKKYAAKGMLAISFEYRLLDVYGTSIIECVKDTKSAIKWLRKHSAELGVDPNQIIAEGFSAGGHLVAAAALVSGFEEAKDHNICSAPNALILQSASYNFVRSKWFSGVTMGKPESVSPYHHLKKGMVPTIMFHATNDYLVSIDEFKEFVEKMKSLNNNFEHYIFEGAGHFFRDKKASDEVSHLKEKFLKSKGYLN